MGELFDHGIDSWAAIFVPLGICSLFGRGDHGIGARGMYVAVCNVMVTFLVSHWEQYNTGVFYLPWAYDLSQLVSVQI